MAPRPFARAADWLREAMQVPRDGECSGRSDSLVDVDEDAFLMSQPCSKGRPDLHPGLASWFRDGPKSLTEILQHPQQLSKGLVDFARIHAPGLLRRLRQIAHNGFVTTSCFSGLGTFEISAKDIMKGLNEELGVPANSQGPVVRHSVTEKMKRARQF